jgi:hypothetical protein
MSRGPQHQGDSAADHREAQQRRIENDQLLATQTGLAPPSE